MFPMRTEEHMSTDTNQTLTLKEWDEASTEQRQRWLDEGRLLSVEDAIKLRNRTRRAKR